MNLINMFLLSMGISISMGAAFILFLFFRVRKERRLESQE